MHLLTVLSIVSVRFADCHNSIAQVWTEDSMKPGSVTMLLNEVCYVATVIAHLLLP